MEELSLIPLFRTDRGKEGSPQATFWGMLPRETKSQHTNIDSPRNRKGKWALAPACIRLCPALGEDPGLGTALLVGQTRTWNSTAEPHSWTPPSTPSILTPAVCCDLVSGFLITYFSHSNITGTCPSWTWEQRLHWLQPSECTAALVCLKITKVTIFLHSISLKFTIRRD